MKLGALAAFAGLTAATAAVGGRTTLATTRQRRWYRRLKKPPFQPPAQVFGPVWTVLYTLIAASGYRVYRARPGRDRDRALALWGTQLGLNALWTELFFGRRRPGLALAELTLLLAAVAAYAAQARKVDPPAAAMVAPYLGWTAFATVLNEEIVRRN